jgi:putative Holliday junction resolvase
VTDDAGDKAGPAARTYLGFDYGEKFIGVAVGSTTSGRAQPLVTVRVTRGGEPDWDALTRLVGEWRPQALIVGLPLNMDGTPGPRTARARKFGNRLKARYNLPVDMVDERLTTVLARNALTEAGVSGRRQKPQLDRQAAALILQAFLNDSREADA